MLKHTIMPRKTAVVFSWLLFLHLFVLQALADVAEPLGTCYDPGGRVAPNNFPCDQAYITQCCPMGWTCYSNNICAVTDPRSASSSQPVGTSIRATCTNPEWNNDVCGDFCLSRCQGPNKRKQGLIVHLGDSDINGELIPCGNDTSRCAGDQASGARDCAKGTRTTSIASGRVQTVIGIIGAQSTQTPMFSTAFSTKSLASAASQSKPVPTSNNGTGASSSSLQLQSKTPTTKTIGFKAGIGTAGTVIGLGILFLLWRFIRRCFGKNDAGAGSKMVGYAETPDLTPPNGDPYINLHSMADVQDPPTDPSRSGQLLSAPSSNPYEAGAPSNPSMSNLSSSTATTAPAPANSLGERSFVRARHAPLAGLPFTNSPYERETYSEFPMTDDRY